MATTLAVIGLGLTAVKAFGQFQEGKAQAQAQDFNIAAAKGDIAISEAARELEKEREEKRLSSFLSTQQANVAKAGVLLSGSPLAVLEDRASDAELDIIINDINASIEQSSLRNEISQREIAGAKARAAGAVRAGTTLLTGLVDFGEKLLAPKV